MAIPHLLTNIKGNINTIYDGFTAVILASFYGQTKVVDLLIAKGADVNVMDNDGETALMKAASRDKPDVVKALLKGKANINAKNKDGKTALSIAIDKGNESIISLIKAAE